VLSYAPLKLFLDPSHTYRLWFDRYDKIRKVNRTVRVRRVKTKKDARSIIRLFSARHMVPPSAEFILGKKDADDITFFMAEVIKTGKPLGVLLAVDHKDVINDPDNGSSIWSLAVDPHSSTPGVGELLVRHAIDFFIGKGRSFIDLSVMHDNRPATRLYEKLGFERVPVFCVKHKNVINEPLYSYKIGNEDNLNIYAKLIVEEAKRRGITFDIKDSEDNHFSLTFGARTVECWESLTNLTHAIAVFRCADKRMTNKLMRQNGISVPRQIVAKDHATNLKFLEKFKKVVVKPRNGEQGRGVFVDVKKKDLKKTVERVSEFCGDVLLEEMVDGKDLRVIVINGRYVAAAMREPPTVYGDGKQTIRQLIEKYSRRREAATGGESKVPVDEETEKVVSESGWKMEDVLPENRPLTVRKTANVHTGGKIRDVTERVHPELREVSERISKIIDIPVVGLDFMVPGEDSDQYVLIEANERPGLANHEPAPTAERFVDFLFPESADSTREESGSS